MKKNGSMPQPSKSHRPSMALNGIVALVIAARMAIDKKRGGTLSYAVTLGP